MLHKVQNQLKAQTLGAVIMPASMGRGLNIRFENDSKVRVIANGD